MELSAKALFKLIGIDFPKKHEIKFDRKETKRLLKELLDKDFPKSFYEKDKIPRLFFLTQFWEKFYILSKYGIDKLNIGPDDLFEKEEAKLALKHAKECYNIASGLENAIRIQKLL